MVRHCTCRRNVFGTPIQAAFASFGFWLGHFSNACVVANSEIILRITPVYIVVKFTARQSIAFGLQREHRTVVAPTDVTRR
jgi:hypothetical protein